MIIYPLLTLATALFCFGLIRIKGAFFTFALSAAALLNAMLDPGVDDWKKQRLLIKNLKALLPDFGKLLILLVLVAGIAILPILLYLRLTGQSVSGLEMSPIYSVVSMLLGSLVLFFYSGRSTGDYSDMSKLLHRMVLGNYNLSKSLFSLEKIIFKKKVRKGRKYFIVVSGLARAGTTAMTHHLFNSHKFHSLTYANMPFLLSVNVWRWFYRPRKNKLRERAHADRVQTSLRSIEAFDEYFFKAKLQDSFVTDDALVEHAVDETIMHDYLIYQDLICRTTKQSIYLTKNNNMLLRYRSMRGYHNEFKMLIMVRQPLSQAQSLMNQHLHFTGLQDQDPFVLEYMNWLGHCEFGKGQKVFRFGSSNESFNFSDWPPTSIEYWLEVWINYYSFVLEQLPDEQLVVIDYEDLADRPEQLMAALELMLNVGMQGSNIDPFQRKNTAAPDADPKLLQAANDIHARLMQQKLTC